jgi:hypothetical protein
MMTTMKVSTPSENMTETSIEEENMADDLRTRYNAINAKAEKLAEHVQAGVTSPAAAFGVSVLLTEALGLARDAVERLEGTKAIPEVRIDAIKWQQKPLASYSIEYGGRGKHTVEGEMPIPAGPIDIREFTCRRA